MANNIVKIQVFGERCSGTNYLESLLLKNFVDIKLTTEFGHKHLYPIGDATFSHDCLFLTCYRDIFDWLHSFHLQPYHAAPELRNILFSQFIRREWKGVYTKSMEITEMGPDHPLWGKELPSERCPDTGKRFSNVIDLRKKKIYKWQSLQNNVRNFHNLCYEDLKKSPESILRKLSKKFHISMRQEFTPINSYKGRGKLKYQKKDYHPSVPADIDFILSSLDLQQEKSIGYNVKERSLQMRIQWLELQIYNKDYFIKSILNGKSFKIGRVITWPARILLGKKTKKNLKQYSQ